MVALDLPSVHVGLKQGLQVQLRIGADQESGLAVEQLRSFAQPVTQWFDDNQQQAQIGTGLAPKDVATYLDGDFANRPGGETADLDDRHGVVVQYFFGGGRQRTITAGTPAGAGSRGGWQSLKQFGIFADAPNEGGALGQLPQHRAV